MNPSQTDTRARLLEILIRRSLEFGHFKLASGGESHYYVDVRKTSFDPEGARLAAQLLVDLTSLGEAGGPTAVGGPTIGADPLVTALGLEALSRGHHVDCFVVRKETKDHGAQRRIEGNLKSGAKVVILDDVLTKGGSLASAITAVEEAGAEVVAVACVVDREAGGVERLGAPGRTVHAIFRVSELLEAAGKPSSA
jgi:orotate phosphoribosyltransferase